MERKSYTNGRCLVAKMPLTSFDRRFLKNLGCELERIILEERGYSSLDRFSLEHHEDVTKPTLYAICKGSRDFQFSTLSGIARALRINPIELLNKVYSISKKH